MTAEVCDKAPRQLQRNAATAHKKYQPASGRSWLRTLITCGECGLSMVGIRRRGASKTYPYVYDQCSGHSALTVGRTTRCAAKLIRAERLDAVVWQALVQLLQTPSMIPHLHQTWTTAQQQRLSGLEAQEAQLLHRQQRLERQDQRLLDAYQTEVITLSELQARRQKLTAALQQIEQERQQLAHTQQQRVHWQRVIENAVTFRRLLGDHLDRLSFEERQAVAQCLINTVIVTGEDVDVHGILPCESTPQVAQHLLIEPEDTRTFVSVASGTLQTPIAWSQCNASRPHQKRPFPTAPACQRDEACRLRCRPGQHATQHQTADTSRS
jgi:Recombinase zinc beta ribbon domain